MQNNRSPLNAVHRFLESATTTRYSKYCITWALLKKLPNPTKINHEMNPEAPMMTPDDGFMTIPYPETNPHANFQSARSRNQGDMCAQTYIHTYSLIYEIQD